MSDDVVRLVHDAVRSTACATDAPLLLAVSGGLDSMAMLHAMATVAPARIAGVATFDHGSGSAATRACALVGEEARRLGLSVVAEQMDPSTVRTGGREATWRRARHHFLRAAAAERGARVVTAHTRDDQVETVFMRELRGAGARGLAGLRAPSSIHRPFLQVERRQLRAYVEREGVAWLDDPSNVSRDFLRNRVRHDLLPALRREAPDFDATLLDIGERAAEWRRDLDAVVDRALAPVIGAGGRVSVPRTELRGHSRDSLAILWSALAGRVGLPLDWRGTRRLASFIKEGPRTGSIPLSGGWCLEARADAYVLSRAPEAAFASASLPEEGAIRWGQFTFRVSDRSRVDATSWEAALPAAQDVKVRAWRAGDRLAHTDHQPARRVKRYLTEAGVVGLERAGWPVVVAIEGGAEVVVWIPGVRRSDAATERSGRPVRHYVCERIAR